jgi:hypothetical protein
MGTVAATPQYEDATPLLGDPEALRAKAARDGFLFFRGLLDEQSVLDVRLAALGVLGRHGLRPDGAPPLSGKLDLERLNAIPAEELRLDIGVTHQQYFELQSLPEFHRLPHHPALLRVYQSLFGEEVFVHPRHIMRAMTPHPATGATPPHQDFPLIQGAPETWTCWFPLGDCAVELGPLTVLRGSHRDGYVPVGNDYGTDDNAGFWTDWGVQLCDHEVDWVAGAFSAGDAVTFSSFTIHRSMRATIRDEIRLSADVRYQRASDPVHEASLTNHSDRPWEEIYARWSERDGDLRYYWESDRPSLSPWDESLVQPGGRRIC